MPGVLGRHLLELEDARDAMSQSKRRINLACQAAPYNAARAAIIYLS